MKKLIERPTYMKRLKSFKDKKLIKVITGIRRCGKSTLFDLWTNYLREEGVDERRIIRVNLEDPEYYALDWLGLYKMIRARMDEGGMNYIMLDEVQNVRDFQKAVDGLLLLENADIYVTGSNAFLLSGELATLLSGRYVEIHMMPLSFKEFVSCVGETDLGRKYSAYLENGSFPYVPELDTREEIRAYLEAIYTSVIVKDISIRNRIKDLSGLRDLVRFMADNVGNLTSPANIANTMTSSGHKVSQPTVESYLSAITESYVFYRADRYDIKGKQYLSTGAKYYIADTGLRFYLIGRKGSDRGHLLENIVFLELKRRGFDVFVGKLRTGEVDFVAIGDDGPEYYQVAETVRDADGITLSRELTPLESIPDHNPKYLLTLDDTPALNHSGIRQLNVLDWLLL